MCKVPCKLSINVCVRVFILKHGHVGVSNKLLLMRVQVSDGNELVFCFVFAL